MSAATVAIYIFQLPRQPHLVKTLVEKNKIMVNCTYKKTNTIMTHTQMKDYLHIIISYITHYVSNWLCPVQLAIRL